MYTDSLSDKVCTDTDKRCFVTLLPPLPEVADIACALRLVTKHLVNGRTHHHAVDGVPDRN